MKYLKFLWCKITEHKTSPGGKTCLKCGAVKRYSKKDQLWVDYFAALDRMYKQQEEREIARFLETIRRRNEE